VEDLNALNDGVEIVPTALPTELLEGRSNLQIFNIIRCKILKAYQKDKRRARGREGEDLDHLYSDALDHLDRRDDLVDDPKHLETSKYI